jgi:hypothetical protein
VKRCRRSIFLVDREVQGSLVFRTALYWLFCLFSVSLMLICWETYTGPRRSFFELSAELVQRYGPALLASLVLLPIAMMDVVRFSNRFVGPVVRMRNALRVLAKGESIPPLQFRDNDFWREMAVDVNQVAGRLFRAEKNAHSQAEIMTQPAETPLA